MPVRQKLVLQLANGELQVQITADKGVFIEFLFCDRNSDGSQSIQKIPDRLSVPVCQFIPFDPVVCSETGNDKSGDFRRIDRRRIVWRIVCCGIESVMRRSAVSGAAGYAPFGSDFIDIVSVRRRRNTAVGHRQFLSLLQGGGKGPVVRKPGMRSFFWPAADGDLIRRQREYQLDRGLGRYRQRRQIDLSFLVQHLQRVYPVRIDPRTGAVRIPAHPGIGSQFRRDLVLAADDPQLRRLSIV